MRLCRDYVAQCPVLPDLAPLAPAVPERESLLGSDGISRLRKSRAGPAACSARPNTSYHVDEEVQENKSLNNTPSLADAVFNKNSVYDARS